MQKTIALTVILLSLAGIAMAANKESGSTTLTNIQPAGTTDKQHKKQQYDLTFSTTKNDYTCRTNEKDKLNATDWVVGSTINYKISGNKGEVKNMQSNKDVKCMVVRVAAVTAPAAQ
jgi:hypothetical protein